MDYVWLIIGLTTLVIGGDILVRGSVGLAEKLAIPPLIIGLTIVAFGTSAPEMLVSVNAALNGVPGIAIGNVVGSNIANVLLVLGLPSIIRATTCHEEGIHRNLLICIGITIVFAGMLSLGQIGRLSGLILLALLALFIFGQITDAKIAREEGKEVPDYHDEVENTPTTWPAILGLLAVGLVLLPLGSDLTVDSATAIAKSWHVSDEVIGLTIVAFGTSLPELATTLMAVVRKSASVAIGNVVGSNILNIIAIMGVTATIKPIPVSSQIIHFDMWVMLASTLMIALFAFRRITISRGLGVAMVLSYIAYVVTVYYL